MSLSHFFIPEIVIGDLWFSTLGNVIGLSPTEFTFSLHNKKSTKNTFGGLHTSKIFYLFAVSVYIILLFYYASFFTSINFFPDPQVIITPNKTNKIATINCNPSVKKTNPPVTNNLTQML